MHLHWIWGGFAVMSRTRLVNQNGPQPITVSELWHFCDIEGIFDDEDRRDLLFHVTELDTEWLRVKYEQIERAQEKQRKEFESKRNGRRR